MDPSASEGWSAGGGGDAAEGWGTADAVGVSLFEFDRSDVEGSEWEGGEVDAEDDSALHDVKNEL